MSKPMRFGLFALLVVAQLYVPASMIRGHERVLREGELLKFRTMPIDPYDAMRGRYVWMGFDVPPVPIKKGFDLGQGRTQLYVRFETDAEAWAEPVEVLHEAPEEGPYLKCRVYIHSSEDGGVQGSITLPFDRYYMNENLAPEAERAYRDASRFEPGEKSRAHVDVRVLDGAYVVEQLYIDNIPIEDYVRQPRDTPTTDATSGAS